MDIASINIESEFDDILKQILEITCRAMNAHSGTIMLTGKTDKLRMVAKYGLSEDYIDRVYKAAEDFDVPLTSSPSGTALKTGQHYEVPNLFEEPKCRPWINLSKEMGFTSQIFTPMIYGMEVLGLLNVYFADEHHFTKVEIEFVKLAASQAASIVHNAKTKTNGLALIESEKKYHNLFDNSSDPMFILDDDTNFLEINMAGAEMLGYTQEEIIGTHTSKYITPKSMELINERRKKRKQGIKIPRTILVELPGAKHRYIEVKSIVIRRSGRREEVCCIARDVTETQMLSKIEPRQKAFGYLIRGVRGGKTRELILNYISDKSYNANQLATALNLDYKTIRHHLDVLVKSEVVGKIKSGSKYNLYYKR